MGTPFPRLFDRFLKNVIISKFKIELGRLICRFAMAEKSRNKRRVVYDPINSLRVK